MLPLGSSLLGDIAVGVKDVHRHLAGVGAQKGLTPLLLGAGTAKGVGAVNREQEQVVKRCLRGRGYRIIN